MPTSTLTTKGQVTIPKAVRDRLDLHPGDVLDFRFDERGRIILEPVAESSLERVSGILRHLAPEKPVSVEDMRKAMLQRFRETHG